MFNKHFSDLFTTPLPPRFRNSLVDFGRGSPDSGSGPGGSQGPGDSNSSGGGGSNGGSNGGSDQPDTMGGMTVTGKRDTGPAGGKSPGPGSEHSNLDMSAADFADKVDKAFSLKDKRTTAQKVKDFLSNLPAKALTHMISQNVFAKNIQKALDAVDIGFDIESAVAKALTSVKKDNPNISDVAAQRKATESALTSAIDEGNKQHGDEHNVSDWLQSGLADSYEEARINPTTGESTAPKEGTWDHYVEQFFGSPEGSKSMQDMLQGRADYMKEQQEAWKGTQETALDEYGTDVDRYGQGVEKQAGLLDDLVEQSREGSGLFSPVKFKLAGQEIGFVPKAQRAQADQMASLGQGQVGVLKSLLDAQQGLYGKKSAQADKSLEQSKLGAPDSGGVAYLDSLKDLAKTGEGISLAGKSLAEQVKAGDRTADANKPGVLDYMKAIGSFF